VGIGESENTGGIFGSFGGVEGGGGGCSWGSGEGKGDMHIKKRGKCFFPSVPNGGGFGGKRCELQSLR